MKDLTEITEEEFGIILDLKYFTKDNVTNDLIYDKCYNFLHIEAVNKLRESIRLAKESGYKLKIFDTYRPVKYQQYIYDKFPGDYVSNPETGSIPHCRGVAVDLTLVNSDGNEISMGTKFDDFSSKAHHGSRDVSILEQKNRSILLSIMLSSGWDFYRNEWWHYQLFNVKSYDPI